MWSAFICLMMRAFFAASSVWDDEGRASGVGEEAEEVEDGDLLVGIWIGGIALDDVVAQGWR